MPKHYGPLLRILHFSIDQAINSSLESMELTAAQGHILGFTVMQETPPCPKDLEEAFHLSHPTVSGLLARMEKKGFLELRADEKDRRCKRVCILPKGRECFQVLHKAIEDTNEQVVRGFSPEEQAVFRELLERAISNMGGWPPDCKIPKEEPRK